VTAKLPTIGVSIEQQDEALKKILADEDIRTSDCVG
jgi:hypothetical protein